MLAIGIDGPGDPAMAVTAGTFSAATTFFFLASGGLLRLYRKWYLGLDKDHELLPVHSKENKNFAQPILASSIICE